MDKLTMLIMEPGRERSGMLEDTDTSIRKR